MIPPTASDAHPDNPLARLRATVEAQRLLEREISVEVRRAHLAGYSWREIASALGVSRQAAHKKYGKATK